MAITRGYQPMPLLVLLTIVTSYEGTKLKIIT